MSSSTYEDLEIGIIAALAPISIGGFVEVVLFPDDEQEFKKAFAKPRISARYHSFDSDGIIDTSTSVFNKKVSVQVMFEAKRTRGPLGIYDLEVQAEALLNGLKLPNYKKLTIGKFAFGERTQDGVWTYNLIVMTEGAANQTFDNVMPNYAIPGLNH